MSDSRRISPHRRVIGKGRREDQEEEEEEKRREGPFPDHPFHIQDHRFDQEKNRGEETRSGVQTVLQLTLPNITYFGMSVPLPTSLTRREEIREFDRNIRITKFPSTIPDFEENRGGEGKNQKNLRLTGDPVIVQINNIQTEDPKRIYAEALGVDEMDYDRPGTSRSNESEEAPPPPVPPHGIRVPTLIYPTEKHLRIIETKETSRVYEEETPEDPKVAPISQRVHEIPVEIQNKADQPIAPPRRRYSANANENFERNTFERTSLRRRSTRSNSSMNHSIDKGEAPLDLVMQVVHEVAEKRKESHGSSIGKKKESGLKIEESIQYRPKRPRSRGCFEACCYAKTEAKTRIRPIEHFPPEIENRKRDNETIEIEFSTTLPFTGNTFRCSTNGSKRRKKRKEIKAHPLRYQQDTGLAEIESSVNIAGYPPELASKAKTTKLIWGNWNDSIKKSKKSKKEKEKERQVDVHVDLEFESQGSTEITLNPMDSKKPPPRPNAPAIVHIPGMLKDPGVSLEEKIEKTAQQGQVIEEGDLSSSNSPESLSRGNENEIIIHQAIIHPLPNRSNQKEEDIDEAAQLFAHHQFEGEVGKLLEDRVRASVSEVPPIEITDELIDRIFSGITDQSNPRDSSSMSPNSTLPRLHAHDLSASSTMSVDAKVRTQPGAVTVELNFKRPIDEDPIIREPFQRDRPGSSFGRSDNDEEEEIEEYRGRKIITRTSRQDRDSITDSGTTINVQSNPRPHSISQDGFPSPIVEGRKTYKIIGVSSTEREAIPVENVSLVANITPNLKNQQNQNTEPNEKSSSKINEEIKELIYDEPARDSDETQIESKTNQEQKRPMSFSDSDLERAMAGICVITGQSPPDGIRCECISCHEARLWIQIKERDQDTKKPERDHHQHLKNGYEEVLEISDQLKHFGEKKETLNTRMEKDEPVQIDLDQIFLASNSNELNDLDDRMDRFLERSRSEMRVQRTITPIQRPATEMKRPIDTSFFDSVIDLDDIFNPKPRKEEPIHEKKIEIQEDNKENVKEEQLPIKEIDRSSPIELKYWSLEKRIETEIVEIDERTAEEYAEELMERVFSQVGFHCTKTDDKVCECQACKDSKLSFEEIQKKQEEFASRRSRSSTTPTQSNKPIRPTMDIDLEQVFSPTRTPILSPEPQRMAGRNLLSTDTDTRKGAISVAETIADEVFDELGRESRMVDEVEPIGDQPDPNKNPYSFVWDLVKEESPEYEDRLKKIREQRSMESMTTHKQPLRSVHSRNENISLRDLMKEVDSEKDEYPRIDLEFIGNIVEIRKDTEELIKKTKEEEKGNEEEGGDEMENKEVTPKTSIVIQIQQESKTKEEDSNIDLEEIFRSPPSISPSRMTILEKIEKFNSIPRDDQWKMRSIQKETPRVPIEIKDPVEIDLDEVFGLKPAKSTVSHEVKEEENPDLIKSEDLKVQEIEKSEENRLNGEESSRKSVPDKEGKLKNGDFDFIHNLVSSNTENIQNSDLDEPISRSKWSDDRQEANEIPRIVERETPKPEETTKIIEFDFIHTIISSKTENEEDMRSTWSDARQEAHEIPRIKEKSRDDSVKDKDIQSMKAISESYEKAEEPSSEKETASGSRIEEFDFIHALVSSPTHLEKSEKEGGDQASHGHMDQKKPQELDYDLKKAEESLKESQKVPERFEITGHSSRIEEFDFIHTLVSSPTHPEESEKEVGNEEKDPRTSPEIIEIEYGSIGIKELRAGDRESLDLDLIFNSPIPLLQETKPNILDKIEKEKRVDKRMNWSSMRIIQEEPRARSVAALPPSEISLDEIFNRPSTSAADFAGNHQKEIIEIEKSEENEKRPSEEAQEFEYRLKKDEEQLKEIEKVPEKVEISNPSSRIEEFNFIHALVSSPSPLEKSKEEGENEENDPRSRPEIIEIEYEHIGIKELRAGDRESIDLDLIFNSPTPLLQETKPNILDKILKGEKSISRPVTRVAVISPQPPRSRSVSDLPLSNITLDDIFNPKARKDSHQPPPSHNQDIPQVLTESMLVENGEILTEADSKDGDFIKKAEIRTSTPPDYPEIEENSREIDINLDQIFAGIREINYEMEKTSEITNFKAEKQDPSPKITSTKVLTTPSWGEDTKNQQRDLRKIENPSNIDFEEVFNPKSTETTVEYPGNRKDLGKYLIESSGYEIDEDQARDDVIMKRRESIDIGKSHFPQSIDQPPPKPPRSISRDRESFNELNESVLWHKPIEIQAETFTSSLIKEGPMMESVISYGSPVSPSFEIQSQESTQKPRVTSSASVYLDQSIEDENQADQIDIIKLIFSPQQDPEPVHENLEVIVPPHSSRPSTSTGFSSSTVSPRTRNEKRHSLTAQQFAQQVHPSDDELLEVEVGDNYFIVKGSYSLAIHRKDPLGQMLTSLQTHSQGGKCSFSDMALLDFSLAPRLRKLLYSCLKEKRHRESYPTLSTRAQHLLSISLMPIYERMSSNRFHPINNPMGNINFCTAENNVCEDLLREKCFSCMTPDPSPDSKDLEHLVHYGPTGGYLSVKQALLRYFLRFMDAKKITTGDILLAPGSNCAHDMLTFTAIEPDELLITNSPIYSRIYSNVEERAGCRLVTVPFKDINHPKMDIEALEEAIDKHSKEGEAVRGVIVLNPHNPLGITFTEDEMIELCEWANKKSLFVIIDEVFSGTIYGPIGGFRPFLSYRHKLTNPHRTAWIWSPSKDFGLPGIRLASVVCTDPAIARALTQMEGLQPCSALAQDFTTRLLDDPEWITWFHREKLDRLRAHRLSLDETLTHLGIPYVQAVAGITISCNFSRFIPSRYKDEEELLETLAERGVFLTPGKMMGETRSGWVRLVFACEKEELYEGLRRLVSILGSDPTFQPKPIVYKSSENRGQTLE